MRRTFAFIGLALALAFATSAYSADSRRPGGPPERRDGGLHGNKGRRNDTIVTGTAAKMFKGRQSKYIPELSAQSAKADETALRVEDGAQVSIGRLVVGKRGNASSEEDSNFHSLNAAVAVWKGSTLTVNGGLVETNAAGANAFVAYGQNASVKVSKHLRQFIAWPPCHIRGTHRREEA